MTNNDTMKQDETNAKVLAQLQEYAQLYFEAIIEVNTKYGKCDLKPGKYSANELTDNSHKSALGHAWELPRDSMFDEELTIEAETFKCSLPYRQIFMILAKWETMMRAGKQKAVFEIGNVEEKSAKVLLNDTTELGAYKEKRVKVQRIIGNWWAPRKPKKSERQIMLYYELNGVMFIPGKYVWSTDDLQSDSTKEWCAKYGDAEIAKLLLDSLARHADDKEYVKDYGYFEEAARRADITAQTEEAAETPQIFTEEPQTVNCTAEGEKEPNMAENNQAKPYYSHCRRVLHNCDLKSWDKFHKRNKNAILVFHYGTSYTALQKEAVQVSTLCGADYTVNRYGTEVCQVGEAALTRIVEQGVYVATAELTKEPEYGIPQPPATATESPRIPTGTAEAVGCTTEDETAQGTAFVSKCIKHRKEYATNYSHYSLYRYNENVYAFGKEAELIREYFIGNKYVPLESVEHKSNGVTYFKFHLSVYNGDLSGRVCHLLEQKHISEYGTPPNGLIVLWDAEEVEYWSSRNNSAPQPPETPPIANYAAPTPKRRQRPRKQPNTAMRRRTRHAQARAYEAVPPCGFPHYPPGTPPTANPPPTHGKPPRLHLTPRIPQP